MARHQVTFDDATEAVLVRAAAHDGYRDVTHMLNVLGLMQAERQQAREATALSSALADLTPADREEALAVIRRKKEGKK